MELVPKWFYLNFNELLIILYFLLNTISNRMFCKTMKITIVLYNNLNGTMNSMLCKPLDCITIFRSIFFSFQSNNSGIKFEVYFQYFISISKESILFIHYHKCILYILHAFGLYEKYSYTCTVPTELLKCDNYPI